MHDGNAAHRIAFLGGGHMARALIAGLVRQGHPASSISVGEPRAAARELLGDEFGVASGADNLEAIQGAALVVLAVKPQDAAAVLSPLRGCWPKPHAALLSIAAGLRISGLMRLCPEGLAILRAMPNRPALLGAGVTALYAPAHVPADARALAEMIATAAGRAVWLQSEAELDLVTALSGSGPAYFLLLAEQLARAAESLGLARDTAMLLAAETLYGAGQLAHRAAGSSGSAALIDERIAVTSPGGTTEAALRALYAGGFEALIERALKAAADRSRELADSMAASLPA